ncbi:MAG TPA: hypothetical protein VJJ83_01585, partial [Candidatus Babeliales bacterium]|nr:hypothetical protein [Candidatus Babeliales bacterium]
KLGVSLTPEFVQQTLTKLGFTVAQTGSDYLVTVPSYRATKDVSLPIDIIEELARFYGYSKLPVVLPTKLMVPHANQRVYSLRKVKQLLATVGQLHEVQTYPFFDEQFLQELQWQPPAQNAIRVQSPVSANWSRLATTLVPNLVKCVLQNLNTGATALNFFECNPTWDLIQTATGATPVERLTLTSVWFTPAKAPMTDFYRVKQVLAQLFDLLALPITWTLVDNQSGALPAWYLCEQTAQIWHGAQLLGYCGALNPAFMAPVLKTKFSGYVCELDLDYLLDYVPELTPFKPLSKYQSSYLDVSLLVPDSLAVQQLEQTIAQAHHLIVQVQLIDSFVKPEWQNQRALTFRYKLVDQQKTMVKAEIDQAQQAVEQGLRALGAQVR